MSARKVVISFFSILLFFSSAQAPAQERSHKTVGDILKRIDKNTKKVTFSKDKAALPTFKQQEQIHKRTNLQAVKPPSRSTTAV